MGELTKSQKAVMKEAKESFISFMDQMSPTGGKYSSMLARDYFQQLTEKKPGIFDELDARKIAAGALLDVAQQMEYWGVEQEPIETWIRNSFLLAKAEVEQFRTMFAGLGIYVQAGY